MPSMTKQPTINHSEITKVMERYSLIAKSLINYHLKGWSIDWSLRSKAVGRCWYSRRLVEVNVHLAVKYGEEEFIETILHEIAHGLVCETHNGGHTDNWKRTYIAIGGNGSVTTEESLHL